MITYSHAAYIKDAIEGVLSQVTDFNFELIISNDFSKDATDAIVNEYLENHPKGRMIRYTFHQSNIGAMANLIFALQQCKGKYIAMCEGDDYWTDPLKLQKQVDLLNTHNDYGLVHHDADYYFQASGELIKGHHKKNNALISSGMVFEELLRANNIYTPTVMFRSSLLNNFLAINKDIRDQFLLADYAMWLTFAQSMKVSYMPESMATYRVLPNSASKSNLYEKSLAFMKSYFDIRLFFLDKYPITNITVNEVEQWRLSMYISTAIKYRKNKEARQFAKQLMVNDWRGLLKKTLVYMPAIFRYIQIKNKL